MTTPREPHASAEPVPRLDAGEIHRAHADFVWKTLFRLGVREADMEDTLQEVFLVVHRRLDSYDGIAKLTTWLFGICMKVTSDYRRRAHRRREQLVQDGMDTMPATDDATPEDAAAAQQARATLARILDGMELEKRAVFVMFELDRMACSDIAGVMGIPVGTVYSRLHAARKAFEEAVARHALASDRGRR